MTIAQDRRAWEHFVETGECEVKGNKFNAEKTVANGRVFDSAMESERAIELQWQLHLGEISDLRYQVRYEVIPKQAGESAVFYVADFVYLVTKDGREVVEDVKGHRTDAYRMKRKLMLQVHGIRILETMLQKKPKPPKLVKPGRRSSRRRR